MDEEFLENVHVTNVTCLKTHASLMLCWF